MDQDRIILIWSDGEWRFKVLFQKVDHLIEYLSMHANENEYEITDDEIICLESVFHHVQSIYNDDYEIDLDAYDESF